MAFKTLLSLIFFVAGAAAAPIDSQPEASDLLRKAFLPLQTAYSGRLSVLREGSKKAQKLDVWYLSEGRLRKDLLGPKGAMVRSVVMDGDAVWFYDRIRRAAWKGGPQDIREGLWPTGDKKLDLLLKNYSAHLLPKTTRVAKRVCNVIDIVSPQGHSLRRIWLDREYGLPLEIKSYNPDGSLAASIRFIRVDFGVKIDESLLRFSPPPNTEIIPSRKKPNFLDTEQLVQGERNPVLPRWVPQGFQLESSDIDVYQGMRVLHSRYSDGVEALSLFQCPDKARLAPSDISATRLDLGDDRRAELSENVQWPSEPAGARVRILQWRFHHRRFVLVGRLPVEAMKRMAESLP